jgi:glycosyltransferase involved in cell wall biosynthesis
MTAFPSPSTPVSTPNSSGREHRVSVALCTYNGARFLTAQLDSYLSQTRPPDEVVACDDGSSDETCTILEDFARRAPFQVHVVRNETRLGSTKNFEKAIGVCTGDLIATSDQDDIWLPEKLARCVAAFAGDPSCGLVFTDAEVVDDELRFQGHSLWDAVHFGPFRQRQVRRGLSFEALLRAWIVTGATMMFRSEYRRFILPIPENWIHDGWIALIVSAMAPVRFLDEKTVRYRQHAGQQIGGRKLSFGELYQRAKALGPSYFQLALERFEAAQARLHGFAGHVRNPMFLPMIDRKVEHQRRRLAISECRSRGKRAALAAHEFVHGGYRKYSPSFMHFVRDMIL